MSPIEITLAGRCYGRDLSLSRLPGGGEGQELKERIAELERMVGRSRP